MKDGVVLELDGVLRRFGRVVPLAGLDLAVRRGGVVVLPVIAILITQATGALLLSVWLLVLAGFLALTVVVALVAIGAGSMARPRLGAKLR